MAPEGKDVEGGKKNPRTKRGHLDPTFKNVCATCRTVQLSPFKKTKKKMFFNYLLNQTEFYKSIYLMYLSDKDPIVRVCKGEIALRDSTNLLSIKLKQICQIFLLPV